MVNKVDSADMRTPEQEAFSLSQSAVILDQARNDKSLLASALERNMELWVAIRMLVSRKDNKMTVETKDNLTKLSKFVAETTMNHGVDISSETLDTLININLQISEGLLEGANTDKGKTAKKRCC